LPVFILKPKTVRDEFSANIRHVPPTAYLLFVVMLCPRFNIDQPSCWEYIMSADKQKIIS
jgi:hypothetical protein